LLVEYFLGADGVMVFTLRPSPEGVAFVQVRIDQPDLARFVRANFGSYSAVRDLIDLGLEEHWHVYDSLVEPIAQFAAPDDVVFLVPHGVLHYLPLHVLHVEGSPLIQRNPVFYCPSASVLSYCLAKRGPPGAPRALAGQAAVFGDARGDLPEARAEATGVARLLGVAPRLGADVTRENVADAIGHAELVHFAGHGRFDREDPTHSGVALFGDGVLSAADVFQTVRLRAELVTLSGCETGVNDRRPGDELIGLTRAFLYAGARSVLVSLWRVADTSTAFLMERFYEYLLATPAMPKVDALRRAMLDVRAQPRWSSWYYWAPFILVGDWR